jgi:hypothetical protein
MTWSNADVGSPSLRPGLYLNFQAEAEALIKGGLTGVVAVVGQAAWGPANTVQSIIRERELELYYTKDETSPFDLPFMIYQAMRGGASKVLAYRIVGANPAKSHLDLNDTTGAPVNVIDLDGKYEGVRGDSFEITIAANPNNSVRKDVSVIENGVLLKKWTTRIDNGGAGMVQDLVDQINDDLTNYWITATYLADGNLTLANITDTPLANGDDGDALVDADYDGMLDVLELEDFYAFAVDTQAANQLDAIETWVVETMREAGKKVVFVTGSDTDDVLADAQVDAQGYNHEGIIYVFPGFKYKNFSGVQQTARGSKAAARVAGMLSGLALTQSITFKQITNIVDLEVRLGNQDVKDALASGIMPLVWDGTRIKVERGLNTLTTPGAGQSDQFKKVHIIRVIDSINNTLRKTASDQIIGQYLNNSIGQDAVLSLFGDFLFNLGSQGIIDSSFELSLDEQNPSEEDRIFINMKIRPIDSIEYIFFTVDISR